MRRGALVVEWNYSGGGGTGLFQGLWQVWRIQMIVRVQHERNDELSVLWHRG